MRPLCAVFLLLCASLAAQVRVQTIDRGAVSGRWTSFTQAGIGLETKEGKVVVPWQSAIAATSARALAEPAPQAIALQFTNGDRLVGRIAGGNFDEVVLRSEDLGDLRVFLDSVTAIEHLGLMARAGFRASAELLESEEDELAVWLNGRTDRLKGELVRLERTGPIFTSAAGEERLFDWDRDGVLGIRLAASAPLEPIEGELVRVELVDGSLLTGKILEFGSRPRIALAIGQEVGIPLEAFRRLRRLSQDFAFLSELMPQEVVFAPWFGGSDLRGFTKDRALLHAEKATIGGESFESSLSIRAKTRLSFEIPPGMTRFQARVGAADPLRALEEPGSVRLEISVDGKLCYESGLLVGGAAPVLVNVPGLAAGGLLQLDILFGTSGPRGAICVLGDPVLSKAP